MLPAATNCPGTSIPEGSFPVSLKLGWHGGIHLHAPTSGRTVLPVRCVADGQIVYARRPSSRTNDASHPQNYNPYGESPSWTDNGIVIIKHVTDIGIGSAAKDVVFYSLIAHLSELKGGALKVANGTAKEEEKWISRKEIIGYAGQIYGAADHVHLEIICDEPNLNRLTGRCNGTLNLGTDGRSDTLYGEIYFHPPSGTKLYSQRPSDAIEAPVGATCYTTTEPLIVGIRYCDGNGDHPGDANLTTYAENGTIVGSSFIREPDAEYDLLTRAAAIAKAFETSQAQKIPSVSALYELLRFGRIIGPDKLIPAETPHWRRVNHPTGAGWVNLNASGVYKFSDADFPEWKGWRLICDDTDRDSRCNSGSLIRLIEDSADETKRLTHAELVDRLSLPRVRTSLNKVIAKFPSEWNRDTIDERWGWLRNDPEFGLKPSDWKLLQDHISALTVSERELPDPLRTAHWHFHPKTFIAHLRNCSWLSEAELAQTLPKYLFYNQSGNPRTAITSSNLALTRSEASRRLARHHMALNQCIRKYIGPSKQRLAIFLAQVTLETAQWRDAGPKCRLMHEWYFGQYSAANPATQYYTAFYGRGIMQLTWAGNYKTYGEYRAFPNHTGPYVERLTPGSPRITSQSSHYEANPADHGKLFIWSPRFDPDIVGEDPYAACDSGGHYWVGKYFSGHININRACDQDYSPASIGLVNRLVNGGGNGYYERQAYAAYLMRLLTEDTSTETAQQINLPSSKSSIVVNFSRT